MPSPIGHALAGMAVAWGAECATRRPAATRTVATCATLAALPDLDLVWPGGHRMATHSVTAVCLVIIIAAAVTGRVTRWRTACLYGAAYASHLLLDWLGTDNFPPRGIQIFWPLSDRWFISDWDIFRQTALQNALSSASIQRNLAAVAQELAIMLPILAVLWLVRVKTAAGLATELPGRHHPTQ